MEHPSTPSTDYSFLDTALEQINADAFVHIADRFDDDLQYLTRFSGPDRPYAFVYCKGNAILLPPSLFYEQGVKEFPGDTVIGQSDRTTSLPAEGVVELLNERAIGHRVAIPPQIRHEDYRTLSEAGYELVSTTAVSTAREQKTDAEQDCLLSVEAAAQKAMRRGESILADAEISGDKVVWQDAPLTTEVLRREINSELARQGVRDAGYSVIGAGPSCADLHFTGNDDIQPGESILIDLSPRGPNDYYADLTRTFVVGEPNQWLKTAYEAVEQAYTAALSTLNEGSGMQASDVHKAATEALASHGFESGYDLDVGFYHGVGHGVGIRLHEEPSLTSDDELTVGNVVTVEPGVYNPNIGGVRIEDLVVITEEGYENLVDYPRSLTPRSSSESNTS